MLICTSIALNPPFTKVLCHCNLSAMKACLYFVRVGLFSVILAISLVLFFVTHNQWMIVYVWLYVCLLCVRGLRRQIGKYLNAS